MVGALCATRTGRGHEQECRRRAGPDVPGERASGRRPVGTATRSTSAAPSPPYARPAHPPARTRSRGPGSRRSLAAPEPCSWNLASGTRSIPGGCARRPTILSEGAAAGGQPRHNIGAVRSSTGRVTAPVRTLSAEVSAIATTRQPRLSAGHLTRVDARPRTRWPRPSERSPDTVRFRARTVRPCPSRRPRGQHVYVGGRFTRVCGHKSRHLALLSPTGRLRPLQSHPSFPVTGVVATARRVYVSGTGPGGHVGSYRPGSASGGPDGRQRPSADRHRERCVRRRQLRPRVRQQHGRGRRWFRLCENLATRTGARTVPAGAGVGAGSQQLWRVRDGTVGEHARAADRSRSYHGHVPGFAQFSPA